MTLLLQFVFYVFLGVVFSTNVIIPKSSVKIIGAYSGLQVAPWRDSISVISVSHMSKSTKMIRNIREIGLVQNHIQSPWEKTIPTFNAYFIVYFICIVMELYKPFQFTGVILSFISKNNLIPKILQISSTWWTIDM